MPVVSVIVPVHNAERYLTQCLDSLIHQTLTDLELIFVDDGSTDSSPEILARYAANDSRIKIVSGPSVGSAGAARNAGLDVATGTYLAFLDADDFFAPSMLAELYKKAERHNAQVVLTKFRVFDESVDSTAAVDWPLRLQQLPAKAPFSAAAAGGWLFLAVNPAAWNKLFRADFIRATGLRFQPLRRANDAFFTYMALAHADRISYVNKHPITYRIGNSGSLQGSRHETPLDFADALAAMQAHLKDAGLYPRFERAFVNLALDLSLSNLRRAASVASFNEIHHALTSELLAKFTITERPSDYFVRKADAAQLTDLLTLSQSEWLFKRLQAATELANSTRAEARSAVDQLDLRARLTQALSTDPAESRPPRNPSEAAVDVSVVIPAYNTEVFLRECVQSALAQSGVSLQVVCVDDGSTDSCGEILDQLAASDPRVEVIHQANAGLSMARNAGLASCRGRYVCFLDSDDIWREDGLADLVALADSGGLDVLMFDAVSFAEPGVSAETWKQYDGYYERSARYGEAQPGSHQLAKMVAGVEYRASACLYLVRRDLVVDHELQFFPGLTHEDNLFTFSLLLAAERAAHTPQALYGRRVRRGSIMTAGNRLASARGFFISYVEMTRLVQGKSFEPWVSIQLGRVIQSMYRLCRDNFVKLSLEASQKFSQIDPGPDAQAVYHMLARARREGQLKHGPQPRAMTGPERALRRVAGRVKRYLQRTLSSER